MTQSSVILPTTGTISGLQMTQATNNALETLHTLSSGASAPSAPLAGQLWHDTSTHALKLRSQDNSGWIKLVNLNEAAFQSSPEYATALGGMTNRIINPCMTIDQVKEGAAYSIPTNNTFTYTLDQWLATCYSASAAGVTVERSADAPAGIRHSLKMTVGTGTSAVSGTDYCVIGQPLEANNLSDLGYGGAGAAPISLSFWVKASVAGTYSVVLQDAAGTRSCVNKFTLSSTGSWQFVTLPAIPGDTSGSWASGNAAMLSVYFIVGAASYYHTATHNVWQSGAYFASSSQSNNLFSTNGASFQVTGVMLNAGVFCLPLGLRGMQQETELCQRYFEKTFMPGVAVAQNAGTVAGDIFILSASGTFAANSFWWQFQTRKRTAPTLVTYNTSAANANWRDTTAGADKTCGVLGTREWGAGLYVQDTATVANNLRIHATANARM